MVGYPLKVVAVQIEVAGPQQTPLLEPRLRAQPLRIGGSEVRQIFGLEAVALGAGHLAEESPPSFELDREQRLRPERHRAVDDDQREEPGDHEDRQRQPRPHHPDQGTAAGAQTGVSPGRVALHSWNARLRKRMRMISATVLTTKVTANSASAARKSMR